MNIDDLPDDSDTSDEDYVPEGATRELPSEEESDGDVEDDIPTEDDNGKRTKRQSKGKRKKKFKNDVKETTNQQVKEVDKKATESLWADFMKDTGFKTRAERQTTITPTPSITKTEPITNNTKEQSSKTVKITEVYNFAGEEVKIEKEVTADVAKLQNVTSGSTTLGKKGGGSKLNSLLSQLGKTKKISTLEKSKLDWDKFKKDEKIEDELQAYGKSKDGYLERQDFLQRADQRRFEIEKDIRNSVRTNKINNLDI